MLVPFLHGGKSRLLAVFEVKFVYMGRSTPRHVDPVYMVERAFLHVNPCRFYYSSPPGGEAAEPPLGARPMEMLEELLGRDV